jgi:uncharacterized membrane protein (DUF4010 family)
MRTFALIGLLGGVIALLDSGNGWILGLGFLGFSGLIVAGYVLGREPGNFGATTLVAALLTFGLGALAARGQTFLAVSSAIVSVGLLSLKPELHRWLRHLERQELQGTWKMLLISVVLLPVLPNEGMGPYKTLNPHQIWMMVVLIAGVTFVGYFLVKLAGLRMGTLLTAFIGGLVSSTAVTLDFARKGKKQKLHRKLYAAGILIAWGVMFLRQGALVLAIYPSLLEKIWKPFLVMSALDFVFVLGLLRPSKGKHLDTVQNFQKENETALRNPFEFFPALIFGLFLGLILLLAEVLRHRFGDAGIYVLSGFSGLADVDAITLSLAHLSTKDLDVKVAVQGITIAAASNTLVKCLLAQVFVRGKMGRYLWPVTIGVLGVAGSVLFVLP